GSSYAIASENYGAQAVVKAFALEDQERDRFSNAAQRLFGREVRLQLFGGVFGLSVNVIVTVLQLVVLALGSWLILHGHLTIGGFVAFSTMMGQVLSPVTSLTGLGQQIQAAMGSLLRINEIVDATADIDDAPEAGELTPLRGEIRLDEVAFSYVPGHTTLEAVN